MAVTLSTDWKLVAQKYLGNSAGNVYVRTYARYSSQDVKNNATRGVQQQLRLYFSGDSYIICGAWSFSARGNYYTSTQAVNNYNDIVVASHSSASYTFYGGETTLATSAGIDVGHNSDGTKSITMACWGSFTSWGWEGDSGSADVNLPTIDRAAPSITQSQTVNSATSITVSGTSNVDCSEWAYRLDANDWVSCAGSARSASATITVIEGIHSIQIASKKTSNGVWGQGTSGTVDTNIPRVSFSVESIGTNSITIDATSNIASVNWGYSRNGGTSYTDITYQTGTGHHQYTFTNLDINTEYSIAVRVKNPANNLYGYSSITVVKTEGGILHVKVGNTWEAALAYVKVGNAWKQAIVYTKVGNNWRIGT